MQTEISIPFNEMLVTRDMIIDMTVVVQGLTTNGFNVKILLKGKPDDYIIKVEEGFDPALFVLIIEGLIARVGPLRGIVELVEELLWKT